MCDFDCVRGQLQRQDPMASLVPLENLFRVFLLFAIACYACLIIGFVVLLKDRWSERGRSSQHASPQRNVGRRRGEAEASPSNRATARPSIGAADAARRATELDAEPLPPRIRRRQALRQSALKPPLAPRRPRTAETGDSKKSIVRDASVSTSPEPSLPGSSSRQRSALSPPRYSLAAPRQIVPETPPVRARSTARNVSMVTSEQSLPGATELTASKAPRQRLVVGLSTEGKRRGVPSKNDASTRHQCSVSAASRFYAEVVKRQVALHCPDSDMRSATLAKDIPPPLRRQSRSALVGITHSV